MFDALNGGYGPMIAFLSKNVFTMTPLRLKTGRDAADIRATAFGWLLHCELERTPSRSGRSFVDGRGSRLPAPFP
jgi:hypothetical protein